MSEGEIKYGSPTYSDVVASNISPVQWGVRIETEWKPCWCVHDFDEMGEAVCRAQVALATVNRERLQLHEEAWEDAKVGRVWVGLAMGGWLLAVVFFVMLALR